MIRGVSWFDGAAPRSEDEAVFLATLRAEAARWNLDVLPEHTSALTVLVPLYVAVEVPGLPIGTNKKTILQGGYWARGPAGLALPWSDRGRFAVQFGDDSSILMRRAGRVTNASDVFRRHRAV
jgi:hypothetical protein